MVVQQADQPSDIIVSEGVQQQLVVGDGLQYQQQYIIRHEPPPPPPPSDFQQQQQQQQQALHRHQVSTCIIPKKGWIIVIVYDVYPHWHIYQNLKIFLSMSRM